MSGFFGSVSKTSCVHDIFYGTDYHSHLGTKRAGMVVYSPEKGSQRAIHSLEEGYFRTKFESTLSEFSGNLGMGVISDSEAQPILISAHMGRFAVATVLVLLAGFAISASAGQLFVAPQGNDAWSGTRAEPNAEKTDGPLATWERARDEIRKRKAAGPLPAGGGSSRRSGVIS